MRLLLDEHLSPELAQQLRGRGHDVIAVAEREGLRGRADRVHFAAMAVERRAIVTADVSDCRRILGEAVRSGSPTYGLVCLSWRRFSPGPRGFGPLLNALDRLLHDHPEDDAAMTAGGEIWLQPPEAGR